MSKKVVYQTITGKKRYYFVSTGPKSKGYIRRLFRISPEYLAALQAISQSTGGIISVNELVRRAVRMYLTEGLLHPVYTGLVKS